MVADEVAVISQGASPGQEALLGTPRAAVGQPTCLSICAHLVCVSLDAERHSAYFLAKYFPLNTSNMHRRTGGRKEGPDDAVLHGAAMCCHL